MRGRILFAPVTLTSARCLPGLIAFLRNDSSFLLPQGGERLAGANWGGRNVVGNSSAPILNALCGNAFFLTDEHRR
ncbi:hypothetical protein CEXT_298471 [Caerostris extrusa]|uniref:Secreted protein n=1 Tax=Caerostris extrusa TaxID=172846 RepID=A0AAV4M9E0_CAEEX|nr:hypothetical protein CEXT_298471 [Caerostris extrusa]